MRTTRVDHVHVHSPGEVALGEERNVVDMEHTACPRDPKVVVVGGGGGGIEYKKSITQFTKLMQPNH